MNPDHDVVAHFRIDILDCEISYIFEVDKQPPLMKFSFLSSHNIYARRSTIDDTMRQCRYLFLELDQFGLGHHQHVTKIAHTASLR